jgi:DNA-binding transcriptional regulator YiaG
MSTKLSFKEALARRGDAPEEGRASSDFPAVQRSRFLLIAAKIEQPVELAKTLRDFGMSLRKAHDALNRLAENEIIAVQLDVSDIGAAIGKLNAVGVVAAPLVLPNPDIKKIREKLRVSQAEFAQRFFLELDTLQNWEQGRHQPDAPTRLLLKIIEMRPEVVDAALIGTLTPAPSPTGASRVSFESRSNAARDQLRKTTQLPPIARSF